MTDLQDDLPLAIAALLDRRMHDTLDTPFELARARLYGVSLLEPGPQWSVDGARVVFVGDRLDAYTLVSGPEAVLVRGFDAAVVVTTGWGAPLDALLGSDGVDRPSRHPARYRMRLCSAVCDDGQAAVLRRADDPDRPVPLPGPGEGPMADAIDVLWNGSLGTDHVPRPAPSWTGGRCRRR